MNQIALSSDSVRLFFSPWVIPTDDPGAAPTSRGKRPYAGFGVRAFSHLVIRATTYF